MAHQFKKAEKLCNQSQIDLLFCEGKTLSQFPFRLIWLQKNNKELPLQTLISVPKKRIAKAYESASSDGDNCILLTSPIIRRTLSSLIRQNIEDLNVLAFTELPETRKIKVLATIENKNEETKK